VDAEFVLVRGRAPADPPPNVRVTGWIPVDRALRHAAAFVHHGGSGGMLQALAAGVPQLAVPGSADRRDNAELVARRGAGLAVGSRRITAAVLTRLVEDPALRLAAGAVAEEIAAMPDAASVVPRLEALAAG
jgi:UDP:flavonoid glycosyltransferase YjiC (YdhE family)